MKLDVTFPELDALRRLMGAELSSWTPVNNLSPREIALTSLGEGVELKRDLEGLDSGPGKLLAWRGEQCLLYIKDTQQSLWLLQETPEESRRFHVAECQTLKRQRNEGRFERFVVTNNTSGMFRVDWYDWETRQSGETEAALRVCKNCLRLLAYRGYKDNKNIADESEQRVSDDEI